MSSLDKVSKPLVMSVGTARIAGTTLGYVITRTDGNSEYLMTEWATLHSFLVQYHGEWEDTSEAMWRFTRLDFAPTTLKAYFNWLEAGQPVSVIAYANWVLGAIIDQRWAHNKAKALEGLETPPLFISHHGWGQPRVTEHSEATRLGLHLNEMFPRA